MNAKVIGGDYNSDTVVMIECPNCGAEHDCTDARVGWHIPDGCNVCGQRLADDLDVRAEIIAACDDALENWDPTPWCVGCGSMTRKGCDCGPIARNN